MLIFLTKISSSTDEEESVSDAPKDEVEVDLEEKLKKKLRLI